jgi:hypothetical protein
MEKLRARRLCLLAAGLCLALAMPAAAQGIGGAGGGPGGPGAGPGGGPGDRGGGPAAHGGPGGLAGPPNRGSDAPVPPLVRDQDEALEAVRSAEALPLDLIITGTRHLTQGRIVDVELSRAAEAIQYRVKVLEPNGEVRSFFFNAVTGQLVRVE